MHKNIHFGFNWCVASHLCSTQINSKSSKSRKFVCYEPLLKFPEHQFLGVPEHRACSVHSQACESCPKGEGKYFRELQDTFIWTVFRSDSDIFITWFCP